MQYFLMLSLKSYLTFAFLMFFMTCKSQEQQHMYKNSKTFIEKQNTAIENKSSVIYTDSLFERTYIGTIGNDSVKLKIFKNKSVIIAFLNTQKGTPYFLEGRIDSLNYDRPTLIIHEMVNDVLKSIPFVIRGYFTEGRYLGTLDSFKEEKTINLSQQIDFMETKSISYFKDHNLKAYFSLPQYNDKKIAFMRKKISNLFKIRFDETPLKLSDNEVFYFSSVSSERRSKDFYEENISLINVFENSKIVSFLYLDDASLDFEYLFNNVRGLNYNFDTEKEITFKDIFKSNTEIKVKKIVRNAFDKMGVPIRPDDKVYLQESNKNFVICDQGIFFIFNIPDLAKSYGFISGLKVFVPFYEISSLMREDFKQLIKKTN